MDFIGNPLSPPPRGRALRTFEHAAANTLAKRGFPRAASRVDNVRCLSIRASCNMSIFPLQVRMCARASSGSMRRQASPLFFWHSEADTRALVTFSFARYAGSRSVLAFEELPAAFRTFVQGFLACPLQMMDINQGADATRQRLAAQECAVRWPKSDSYHRPSPDIQPLAVNNLLATCNVGAVLRAINVKSRKVVCHVTQLS